MGKLNVPNRTLAIMDNLRFLRSLNNECVDLIAIDPPFAANETFTGNPRPPLTPGELDEEIALAKSHGVQHNEGLGGTRVKDFWTWDDDVHPDWKMQIEDEYPSVHAVIEAVEGCASENEAAYVSYMAARLIHLHRALKPSGSLYLHCDDHANSFLKILLDAIFGSASFKNNISWKRSGGKSDSMKWGRVSDTLLYYTKDAKRFTWNQQYIPLDSDYVSKHYRFDDEDGRGRYRRLPLHAAGRSGGDSGLPWQGYDPSSHDRHWAVPSKGIMHRHIIEHGLIPGWPQAYASIRDKLDALDRSGLMIHSKAYLPEIKTYLKATRGIAITDFVADIPMATGRERTGYATQKPLALYERIIRASSKPGDVVLDVFAGCATTAVAAERLGRRWIACDMAYRSWTMLKRRFYLYGIALEGTTDATFKALASVNKGRGFQEPQQFAESRILGPNDLPKRDDDDQSTLAYLVTGAPTKRVQSSTWSGRIAKAEAKALLVRTFGHVCWGCGYQPRRPNGSYDDTLLEVDHIRARRSVEGEGGNDELYNLALLHRTCNIIKRNRLTLAELRAYNVDNMLLYVDSDDDLVDLYTALKFATEHLLGRSVSGELPTSKAAAE